MIVAAFSSEEAASPAGLRVKRSPLSVEHQHTASDFAGFHRTKRLVHVFELQPLADHVVEIQPALQVEIDIAWHIDPEPITTHHRTLNLALGEELRSVELDFVADRNHSD